MRKIAPCSFCYGTGRLSAREIRFYGKNYAGQVKIRVGAQVICNACKARGPLFTATIITSKIPHTSDPACEEIKDRAIDLWNRHGWVKET